MPHRLSQRELEVAALICRGEQTDAIAAKLGIRPGTVRTHRASIYAKLGVHSAAELAVLMTRSGVGNAAIERSAPRPDVLGRSR